MGDFSEYNFNSPFGAPTASYDPSMPGMSGMSGMPMPASMGPQAPNRADYGSPGGGAYSDPSGGMGYSSVPGGPNGPVSQYGLTYGDPKDGGMSWNLHNPAMMDPSQLNPYASMYLNNINGMLGQFQNSAAGGAFNPNFYQHLQDTSQANITTSLENSFARAGLGGSSAAMGTIGGAVEKNQMDWLNRQQSDQMRAMQGLEGLNQTGMKDVMGLQGQYGEFQDMYNQDILSLLGVKQQQDAANSNLWSGLAQGVGHLGMAAAFML
jgi:hypothetical protein